MARKGKLVLSGASHYRLFPSARLAVTAIFFAIAFILTVNMSGVNFAINCMANSTFTEEEDERSHGGHHSAVINPCGTANTSSTNTYGGTYRWTRLDQSYVLAGTPLGALILSFVAGYYTDRLGAKIIGTISITFWLVSSALVPISAEHGWQYLFVVRILSGMGLIAGWPVYLVIANQWFPMGERGLLVSIGASANQIGVAFTTFVSGYFCSSEYKWMGFFYLSAVLNGLMLLLWIGLYTDDVENCWYVPARELDYILATRGPGRNKDSRRSKTPWLALFTSSVVWSILIVSMGAMCMYYFVGEYMPTYYKEVLGISVKSSALLSALPAILQFVGRFIAGPIADRLERRFSKNFTVKLMQGVSGLLPAAFLAIASIFGCATRYAAVASFSLSYFFFGFAIVGFLRAALLVAPSYTGTISGLAQTANFIAGLILPYISGAIIGPGGRMRWHWAMYAAAILGAAGSTVFILFGSGNPQPWALQPSSADKHQQADHGDNIKTTKASKDLPTLIPWDKNTTEIVY